MKVGILTLPFNTNYGGILQAWALQTFIKDQGFEASTFLPEEGYIIDSSWKQRIRRLIRICLNKKPYRPVFIDIYFRKLYESLNGFAEKHINSTKISDFNHISEDFDVFVVGSDQIWRKHYFNLSWQSSFFNSLLAFAEKRNVRRLSYAASIGTDEWQYTPEETPRAKELLSLFDAVSVREPSAAELIKEFTGLSAETVADPTLLLDKSRYLELIKNSDFHPGGVVSYILDHSGNALVLADKVAKSKNLKRTEINHLDKNKKIVSLEDWLSAIASAEIVVTDSYHGSIFSIIFGKPLIFTGNTKRGNTRFSCLIETFGLQDNCITDISRYNPNQNYALPADVPSKLAAIRARSKDFLLKNLS